MKKVVSILIMATIISLPLTACGSGNDAESVSETNTTAENEQSSEEEAESPSPDSGDIQLEIKEENTTFLFKEELSASLSEIDDSLRITTENVLQKSKYVNESGFEKWTDIDTDVRSIEFGDIVNHQGALNNTVFYIKTDNTLWGYGCNSGGVLGDGTGIDQEKPVKILDNVAKLYAGNGMVYALKTDKTLWEWGSNAEGGSESYEPIQRAEDIVDVQAGAPAYVLSSSGVLMSDYASILARTEKQYAPDEDIKVPVRAFSGNLDFYYIDGNKSFWKLDKVKDTETEITQDVESFMGDVFIFKTDGSLWGTGHNSSGNLGDGTKAPHENEAVKIADNAVYASSHKYLTESGELWTWTEENPNPQKTLDNVAVVYDNIVVFNDGKCIFNLKNWLEADKKVQKQYEVDGIKVPEEVSFTQ
ncbi:MAG: hypothetical protein LBR68_02450 [Lachnoclostridium sp.]|jgi:alpha-tubulin suppressor-like RCC1 family protein|nr:hypothetical protein [Lachnoclostridium sp.]